MRCPKDIPEEASEYWKRNAPLCEKMGTLREQDYCAFLSLCLTWAKYLQVVKDSATNPISVVALAKQVQCQQARFGLDPMSRKKLGIDLDKNKNDSVDTILGLT